jgi:hypothetical protein
VSGLTPLVHLHYRGHPRSHRLMLWYCTGSCLVTHTNAEGRDRYGEATPVSQHRTRWNMYRLIVVPDGVELPGRWVAEYLERRSVPLPATHGSP